jgi:hypothetical protein
VLSAKSLSECESLSAGRHLEAVIEFNGPRFVSSAFIDLGSQTKLYICVFERERVKESERGKYMPKWRLDRIGLPRK